MKARLEKTGRPMRWGIKMPEHDRLIKKAKTTNGEDGGSGAENFNI